MGRIAMHLRLRLLMATTALLYLGPLLAGLAGQGWEVVPVMALIFVLWLQILRPHEWPRDLAAWRRPKVWARAAARAAVQLLLVVVLFGIGRGIGGVAGVLPLWHPALPVAVSFLSIPLSRLVWDPWKMQATERLLDEAIATLRAPDLGAADLRPPALRPPALRAPARGAEALRAQVAAASVAELLALPETTAPADLVAAVDEVVAQDGGGVALAALVAALPPGGPARPALRRAVIDWAVDPDRVARAQPWGTVRAAMAVAGQDAALLRHVVPRATRLAGALPHLAEGFPSTPDLFDTLAGVDAPDLREGLLDLIRTLERARDPEAGAQGAGWGEGLHRRAG
jgi:hypothetical protein